MPIDAVTVSATLAGPGYRVEIGDATHRWATDEPESKGGHDTAATPMAHLWGALGGCVATTLTMYARTKGVELERVEVRISGGPGADADTLAAASMAVTIHGGDLTPELRERLTAVARRCPVHRVLEAGVRFTTETVEFA